MKAVALELEAFREPFLFPAIEDRGDAARRAIGLGREFRRGEAVLAVIQPIFDHPRGAEGGLNPLDHSHVRVFLKHRQDGLRSFGGIPFAFHNISPR